MANFDELALFRRLAGNPDVLAQINASMPSLRKLDPSLAARVEARDPAAVADAYKMIVDAGEQATRGRSAADNADIFDEDYDVLSTTINDTAMIPYGSRGPGVAMGGPTGSGVTVPAPTGLSTRVTPRIGIPGPVASPVRDLSRDVNLPRLGTTAGVPVYPQQMDFINAFDDIPVRQADEAVQIVDEVRPLRDRISDYVNPRTAAAVAALGAAGSYIGSQMFPLSMRGRPEAPQVPDITSKPRAFSTADLAAETSPPPVVLTEEEEPLTFADRARQKVRQANEIQLREGRITPESAALSREADAFYAQAAEARRSGAEPPIMPVEQQDALTGFDAIRSGRPVTGGDSITLPEPTANDYWQMAEDARATLNAAHRSGASPQEIADLRAKHRQLLDLYDNRRNRRAG